jgi:hypothetical protein
MNAALYHSIGKGISNSFETVADENDVFIVVRVDHILANQNPPGLALDHILRKVVAQCESPTLQLLEFTAISLRRLCSTNALLGGIWSTLVR